jgi:hypothetical protein
MTIKIDIPDNIVTILRGDCGYSKPQCANIFKTYLTEVMADRYSQFELDFGQWLEEQDEEELNQIKEGRQL